MNKIILYIIFLLNLFCLQAKKSSFDLSKPTSFLFGFLFASSFSSGSGNLSISGTITGFTSGSLILQNNNSNDLTLSPTNQFTFSNIAKDSKYSISIKTHPVGLACTLSNATGTVSSNITNVNIACVPAVLTSLYNLGNATQSFWMDYVKSDGTSPINATGVACTGSETGFYNACIHAGEFKKFDIPNLTSCTGITVTDSLSAFQWRCVVSSNGSIFVTSTGLKEDKGLSDLIDFTSPGSFRNNSAIVSLNNTILLTTTPAKWWDNTISVNNTGGNVNISGRIYLVNSSSGTNITYTMGSKVALLVQPGILKQLVDPAYILFPNNTNFAWLEGNFSGASSSTYLLHFSTGASKFNMVRKFRGVLDEQFTVRAQGAIASCFHDVSGTSLSPGPSAGNFFTLENTKNILNHIQAFNVTNNGLNISNPDNIILNSIVMNTATRGMNVDGGQNLFLMNATISNTLGTGILFGVTNQTNFTTTGNLISTNTGINGGVFQYSMVTQPKTINTILAHAVNTNLLTETSNTSNSSYLGIAKFSGTNCTIGSNFPGLGNTTCAKTVGSLPITSTNPLSETTINLGSSFVAKVTSDSKNANGATGSFTFASIADWLNFENRFRGWGNQGTNFPNNGNISRCQGAAICQIWDWSLKATDTVARNVNHCPSGTIVDTHTWSAVNNTSCLEIKGAVWGTTCTTTFLRNAVEIFGDGVGNENGICESNEECIYAPNIGAYQGHGNLVPASQATATTTTCADITTGTVTNVKLWKYETNGY
ncbi:MAG: hypothetical protein SFU98_02285 [Leptospiraceae bacterium]|nr:hypothetical protein [Leptospiraceae bacterium]